MPFEFKLPDIGEGVVEGEIVKWLVKQGDLVEEDQPLVEVMTDKATVEIHSPRAGVIARRIGAEGEVVPVGATLVVIEPQGEATAKAERGEAGDTRKLPAQKLAGVSGSSTGTPTAQVGAGAAPSVQEASGRVLATPSTRRLARQMGVDLASVTGSGPEGRITLQDLEAAGRGVGAAVAPAVADERIPLRGLRRRIAERMVRSVHTAAHYGYVEEIDATLLVQLRDRMEAEAKTKQLKLMYLPFIVKAVVAGLKKCPLMNATLDEERQEIVLRKRYHIGIAVATDQGLLVPVVKDADSRSVWEIAADIERLAEDARRNRSKLEDLQGSTFTITSLGALGGVSATPIINYPEAAILGVHRIRVRPEYVEDSIQPRHMMNISLSVDHRVADGVIAAQFVAEVKRLLESPELLLA